MIAFSLSSRAPDSTCLDSPQYIHDTVHLVYMECCSHMLVSLGITAHCNLTAASSERVIVML